MSRFMACERRSGRRVLQNFPDPLRQRKLSHIFFIRCREQHRLSLLNYGRQSQVEHLHYTAWLEHMCAIVHTFANHLFEEVIGDIV